MLEIGCSFGHITEYLDEEPAVAAVHTFDVDEPFVEITRTALEAGAWRNASWAECLPSAGAGGLTDVTEEAGYGWRFFRDTARSCTRRAGLPAFEAGTSALRRAWRPPWLALPYFNVIFRKLDGAR